MMIHNSDIIYTKVLLVYMRLKNGIKHILDIVQYIEKH